MATMDDERFHLCTHLGVLGPPSAQGQRRCLRCGSLVSGSVLATAEVLDSVSADFFDGLAFEAVHVAQTAEFDDEIELKPSSTRREVG
jgi:hypothetical protein